jgi:HEAT repeat protein
MSTDYSENPRKCEALCRLIELSQSEFSFALVEFDLPSLSQKILRDLRARLPTLNVVTVNLTPPPSDELPSYNVLDQLAERVRAASPEQRPDALFILGFESLFLDARDPEALKRAIQPLNLGRNLLEEENPYPVFLCLPPDAMSVFLQSAPDLTSWRSGYFKFESDQQQVRAELAREAASVPNWWERLRLRFRPPRNLAELASHVEDLIADAQALEVDPSITARAYARLGWLRVTLGDRGQAQHAFGEMRSLALECRDESLIRAAERGLRSAGKVKSRRAPDPAVVEAIFRVFHGGEALEKSESMFGRNAELERLLGMVTSAGCRFLTIWGETGSGKSSLVLSKLVPELSQSNDFLPVLVDRWDNAELMLRHALARASQADFKSEDTLSDCLQAAALKTRKTIVVVCDQFEQFFAPGSRRSRRFPLLVAIGAAVKNLRIPCKFVFVIRQDLLGNLAEFDNLVDEPLSERKRFYLPFFSEPDAVVVLRQLAEATALNWSSSFLRVVAGDLTEDGRVRPIKLQLVGTALGLSGANSEFDYALAGKSAGLLADYIDLVLNSLYRPFMLFRAATPTRLWDFFEATFSFLAGAFPYSALLATVIAWLERKIWINIAKRIMVALVAEPARRVALPLSEIRRGMPLNEAGARFLLDLMKHGHLVRQVDTATAPASPGQLSGSTSEPSFELPHDFLAELVVLTTGHLQDRRRRANRILHRALEDLVADPRHTIGLREWLLVRNNADARQREEPRVRALLGRSVFWGALKWLVIPPIVLMLALLLIQGNSGHITTERDYAERIVVRQGTTWLGFEPFVGDTAIILDTGFGYGDVEREKVNGLNGKNHLQWDNLQSGVLNDVLVGVLKSKVAKGKLLCQLGRGAEGIRILTDELQLFGEPYEQLKVITIMERAAQFEPALARKVVGSLHGVMTRISLRDVAVSAAAGEALARVAQLDREVANSTIDMLIRDVMGLKTKPRLVAMKAVSKLARAVPERSTEILGLLLAVMNDKLDPERQGLALALPGRIARLNSTLAPKVLDALLVTLKELRPDANSPGDDARMSAIRDLGYLVQFNPPAGGAVLDFLVSTMKVANRRSYSGAVESLARLAIARPDLTPKVLPHLADALNSRKLVATYDLQLLAPATDASAIPTSGKSLFIVSDVDHALHLRIFDRDGKIVLDADEDWLFYQGSGITEFRKTLDQLWPPHELTAREKSRVIDALAPNVDYLRVVAAGALVRVAQTGSEAAINLLLDAFEEPDKGMREAVAGGLGWLTRIPAAVEIKLFDRLYLALHKDESSDVRETAARSLELLAPAYPPLRDKICEHLLTAAADKDSRVRAQVIDALGSEALSGSTAEAIKPLLAATGDEDGEVRFRAIRALGRVALVHRSLIESVLKPLVEATKDELSPGMRGAGIAALAPLVRADSSSLRRVREIDPTLTRRIGDMLLDALKNDQSGESVAYAWVRIAAADDATLLGKLFDPLTAFDSSVRDRARNPLIAIMMSLAEGSTDPVQFLLDRLTGRQSELRVGNANTVAGYRNVATSALARWMASRPQDAQRIQTGLDRLRESNLLHLRIAAWNVLAEAAELREQAPAPATDDD